MSQISGSPGAENLFDSVHAKLVRSEVERLVKAIGDDG
jgi:hypothetical protein